MVNSELSEISYVIQAGVTTYPIGFEYHFNENNSPQLLVKIGESVAIINVDFQLSADESEIILIPTEEEARAQSGPNDTRWMDRIVGQELLITRDIPFVQTSDYSVGRINPEQIEYDFDRAVMRDQEILHQLSDFTVDVALAESLANAAVETANEAAAAANQATATANTALDTADTAVVTANEARATATQASQDAVDAMADAASAVNKADAADMTATTAMEIAAEAVTLAQGAYSKTEVDNKITVINAGIDANADAIQSTRADFIAADSDIYAILNNHASELTTLHNDVDAVGDQVSGIEEKIPGTASASNPLITKQQLLDEEMDIREDLNSGLSELQTQVTAQATAIAGKQKQLQPGDNVFINRTNPDYDTISVSNVVSSLNGLSGALNLQAGTGIEIDGLTISATGGGSGGASYTAGDGIDITDNTISTDISVIRNTSTAQHALGLSQIANNPAKAEGALTVGNYAVAIYGASYSIAIGTFVQTGAPYAIQIGGVDASNHDANTLKVGNENGNFEMMSDDGTIPTDRYAATPASAGTYVPKLTIAEDGTATREWGAESGGGGASLPDQTGNAGKFLMTDGENASWGNAWSYGTIPEDTICIGSITDTNASGAVIISKQATSAGAYTVNIGGKNSLGPASVAIGYQAVVDLNKGKSIAIGAGARCMAKNAIQLAAVGGAYTITQTTNSDDNTFKVANNNGNFEMMSADGTIPAARHATLPVADGTYVLKLSIVDGVPTLGWAAE